MQQGIWTWVNAISINRNYTGKATLYQHSTPQPLCQSQSTLHGNWTRSWDSLCASQRIRSTRLLEGCHIGLKCSVRCKKEGSFFRLASILGVNPLGTFVIGAHQNRSLPKVTCWLCSSAWILFILPSTENKRQLLQTSLCIVVFI